MKKEKEYSRKYSVTMEQVPDEEMPNGERLIMIEDLDWDSQDEVIHKINSWRSIVGSQFQGS